MTGFNGQVATKLRAFLSTNQGAIDAKQAASAIGEKPNTVGPLLSTLYYEGWLDRRRGEEGVFLYSNPKRTAPAPREHPLRKRRTSKSRRSRDEESSVRVKVCGVEMSIEEAFEVYEELNSLFENVTRPR
jgi:hypothetical protein